MRALRRLLILLMVLAILAVGVDFGARLLTQTRIADQVKQSQHMSARPDVQIHGFPFLTQLAAGTFDDVEVRSASLRADNGLTIDSVVARMHQVRLPARTALGGSAVDVRVGRAEVTGLLSNAALATFIESRLGGVIDNVKVVGNAAAGTMSVSGSVAGLSLSVPLQVRLTGQKIDISVPDSAASGIAGTVVSGLAMQFTLPELPYGLTVSRVTTGSNGITVAATGTDLVLRHT